MKILVVDDHEFTREGIVRILTQTFSITKIAQADSYESAIEHIYPGKLDLIIVDVNLKGRNGIELITSVRKVDIKVPILVLSMVPVSQYVRRILQAGASGYLTKGEPAEELLKAVRLLINGQRYFSPEVQQEIPSLIDEAIERPRHDELTDRELEILRGLAEGKNNKEIADDFKISVNTVNSYRKRVLLKIRAKTNLDLVRYAIKHDIVH